MAWSDELTMLSRDVSGLLTQTVRVFRVAAGAFDPVSATQAATVTSADVPALIQPRRMNRRPEARGDARAIQVEQEFIVRAVDIASLGGAKPGDRVAWPPNSTAPFEVVAVIDLVDGQMVTLVCRRQP